MMCLRQAAEQVDRVDVAFPFVGRCSRDENWSPSLCSVPARNDWPRHPKASFAGLDETVLHALLILGVLAGQPTLRPPAGCLLPDELVSRLSHLRVARWSEWTRATLKGTWPEGLEESAWVYDTNFVVGYERLGRVVADRVECGEYYHFDTPTPKDRLRELHITHAQQERSDALAVAALLTDAVAPPPDAGPSQTICIDCGDPGEQLVSRQWALDGEINVLEVYVRPGVGSTVLDLLWSRRPTRQ